MDTLQKIVTTPILAVSALLFFGPIIVIASIMGSIELGPLKMDFRTFKPWQRTALGIIGTLMWVMIYVPLVLLAFQGIPQRLMPPTPNATPTGTSMPTTIWTPTATSSPATTLTSTSTPTASPTGTSPPTITPSPAATPILAPTSTSFGFLFDFEGGLQGWMPGAGPGWGPNEKATSVAITDTAKYVSEGKWSLQGEFNGEGTTGDYKATFYSANLPLRDWKAFSSLKFDVYDPLDSNTSLEVTIAIATGVESCWNESQRWTPLNPGMNRLTFPLNTPDYKRCPTWDTGPIKQRDYVQRLHLVFLLKKSMRGTAFIDNVRLEQ